MLKKKCHLSGKILRVLKALHDDAVIGVRAYGMAPGEYGITTGVQQGALLEQILFNLVFNGVIAAITSLPFGVELERGCCTVLRARWWEAGRR